MDERIIDYEGNQIVVSAEGIDDIEIGDIIIEDAKPPEGDLVIVAKILESEIGEVYPAEVIIENGLFKQIIPIITDDDDSLDLDYDGVLIPGFIDSHFHIESTNLSPSNFAKEALLHGTTSVIAEPYAMANVLGIDGIKFMIEDGKKVPFDFYYSLPSSSPSSPFESSAHTLSSEDIEDLLALGEFVSLSERNFQGILDEDEETLSRLRLAHDFSKPIDGFAPLLSGEDLRKYAFWHVSTDYECRTFNEAVEKKELGMKIPVCEGASFRNMDLLFNLDDRFNYVIEEEMKGNIIADTIDDALAIPPFDFLLSGDIDAWDLTKGHLNLLVKKAIDLKINPKEALKMVSYNPARHYGLNCGIIEDGKIANFLLVDDLRNLNISKVWVHGELVVDDGELLFGVESPDEINNFELDEVKAEDFDAIMEMDYVSSLMDETTNVYVIKANDGEMLTGKSEETVLIKNKVIQPDLKKDIIKIAAINRYGENKITNGFVNGFNLKKGAIATTVAPDSYNVIAVGCNSEDMAEAVNLIREHNGGIAVVCGEENIQEILELPIGGMMSLRDAHYVSSKLSDLSNLARELGCTLSSPFRTLSYMGLISSPSFKISDLGLFDGESLKFIELVKQYLI